MRLFKLRQKFGWSLFILLIGSVHSYALGLGGDASGVYLGTGIIGLNANGFGTNELGEKSYFGRIYHQVSLSTSFSVLGISFEPNLFYTLAGRTSLDQVTSKILSVNLPLAYPVYNGALELKAGPGIFWYYLSGPRELPTAKNMANGNSTANFYIPSIPVVSRSYVLDLGIGSQFNSWRVDWDTLIQNPFSSRRTLSFALNLSYQILNWRF